jgi:hypothetical protein
MGKISQNKNESTEPASGSAPPPARIASVDDRGRITIPKDIFDAVMWLKDMPPAMDCAFFPMNSGNVKVDHHDGALGRQHRDICDHLSKVAPSSDHGDDLLVQIARVASNSWIGRLERKERRLQIPGEIGDLGLLKLTQGSRLVVFGYAAILEIWNPEEWLAMQGAQLKGGDSTFRDFLDDLQGRSV